MALSSARRLQSPWIHSSRGSNQDPDLKKNLSKSPFEILKLFLQLPSSQAVGSVCGKKGKVENCQRLQALRDAERVLCFRWCSAMMIPRCIQGHQCHLVLFHGPRHLVHRFVTLRKQTRRIVNQEILMCHVDLVHIQ